MVTQKAYLTTRSKSLRPKSTPSKSLRPKSRPSKSLRPKKYYSEPPRYIHSPRSSLNKGVVLLALDYDKCVSDMYKDWGG